MTRVKTLFFAALSLLVLCGLVYGRGRVSSKRLAAAGWKTDTEKRTIDLSELQSGGPGKDGIPAINNPKFVSIKSAGRWLGDVEPVISVFVNGEAKAYPLQILIWHEIVNDSVGGVDVSVTFCPLCYSAIVYDRQLKGQVYDFGVSGMLRHSDMVMYDKQTESLWQQFTGEAIVGEMTGSVLKRVAGQIISFEQFRSAYRDGKVQSRSTGYNRRYGKNPYVGYDDISKSPFLYDGKSDNRIAPMEKLITVTVNNKSKCYPYSVTAKKRVINDEVGGVAIAVFHGGGAVSALDKSKIALSREVGSTGVFERKIDSLVLTFGYQDGRFVDEQSLSEWDITGKAIAGRFKGRRLKRLAHGDYFAFSWLVFKPETEIYSAD